jgi:mRNA-degrading endonuclease toxin of MazEF toxin-antitoxin module
MIPALHQWDIVKVRINPDDADQHPAVIVSREEFCSDPKRRTVNVLYGTSRRPASVADLLEVTLNGADGLERSTLFSCGHLFTISKEKISSVLGRVAPERRRQIGRKIVEAFRLPL